MKRIPALASPSFSLVEVAIAIAILAVGMTGVMALLPVGLNSAREVHNETVAAGVARTVIGNLQLSNQMLGLNNNLPNQAFYFTAEGVQTNTSNPPTAFYQVLVTNLTPQGGSVTRSYITMRWPVAALGQAKSKVQERFFLTDILKTP